jgi:YARHG domain
MTASLLLCTHYLFPGDFGMARFSMFLAMASFAVIIIAESATNSYAQSARCQSLWVQRNQIYKNHGYCFKTARAIQYFGNGGCRITNDNAVPLSRGEQATIAGIQAQERSLGCPN